ARTLARRAPRRQPHRRRPRHRPRRTRRRRPPRTHRRRAPAPHGTRQGRAHRHHRRGPVGRPPAGDRGAPLPTKGLLRRRGWMGMAGREGGMQDWSEVAANGWVATQRECLRTRNLVRRTDHCRVTSITDTHHHRREISDMEVMKKRQAPARNATQPGRLFSPGGIAGSYSPPFVLPGEHFAAALGAWVLGCAGLVWVAPEVASGLFPLPRV